MASRAERRKPSTCKRGVDGGRGRRGRWSEGAESPSRRMTSLETAWTDGVDRRRGQTVWTDGVDRPRGQTTWTDRVVASVADAEGLRGDTAPGAVAAQ